jgi:hypothetical protein
LISLSISTYCKGEMLPYNGQQSKGLSLHHYYRITTGAIIINFDQTGSFPSQSTQ